MCIQKFTHTQEKKHWTSTRTVVSLSVFGVEWKELNTRMRQKENYNNRCRPTHLFLGGKTFFRLVTEHWARESFAAKTCPDALTSRKNIELSEWPSLNDLFLNFTRTAQQIKELYFNDFLSCSGFAFKYYRTKLIFIFWGKLDWLPHWLLLFFFFGRCITVQGSYIHFNLNLC